VANVQKEFITLHYITLVHFTCLRVCDRSLLPKSNLTYKSFPFTIPDVCFMDMKPDTTNCVYRMLIPDLADEYSDIKVVNCGIVYPVTSPIAQHPNHFGKKLKFCCIVTQCDVL